MNGVGDAQYMCTWRWCFFFPDEFFVNTHYMRRVFYEIKRKRFVLCYNFR